VRAIEGLDPLRSASKSFAARQRRLVACTVEERQKVARFGAGGAALKEVGCRFDRADLLRDGRRNPRD
jgi:hypothetical protein